MSRQGRLVKLARASAVAGAAVLFGAPPAMAVTNTYTGPSGNAWENPANWSRAIAPEASDDVVIPAGKTVVFNDQPNSDEIASLTLGEGTLVLATGTLLDVGAGASEIRGVLSGPGAVSFAGALTLGDSPTVNGGAILNANGATSITTLSLSASTLLVNGAGVLNLNGTTTWSDGVINLSGAGSQINLAGVLTIADGADGMPNLAGGLMRVIPPSGAIVKQGSNTVDLAQLENDDLVDVQGGTLGLLGSDGAQASDGSFQVASGATLRSDGLFDWGATSGIDGPGTLRVQSSTLSVTPGATFSPGTLSFGPATLSLNATGDAGTLTLGNNGTRSGAGTLTVTGPSSLIDGSFTGGGTTTLQGTTSKIGSNRVAVNTAAVLSLEGTTTWSDGTINLSDAGSRISVGGAMTITGTADGMPQLSAGLLRVEPTGALTTNPGTSTTIGPATENRGTLSIPESSSINFQSGFANVAGSTTLQAPSSTLTSPSIGLSGGALAGSGTLAGNVFNGGATIRPGNSPGLLTIQGDFTQGVGGTLEIELESPVPGPGYDRLTVTGTASLAGTLQSLTAASFSPAPGSQFPVLVAGGGVTGTFHSFTQTPNPLPSGRTYGIDYRADSTALAVNPMPAPGAGVPLITGTPAVGQLLTCTEGTWTGAPEFAYAWLRNGTPIAAATARTYTPTGADISQELRCRVTGTNEGGSAQATSAGVTIPVAPPEPGTPAINGTAREGETLTCDTGAWTGSPAFTFAWTRDGAPIAGASAQTLVVSAGDVARELRCVVTGANAGGNATATSAPVTPVASPVVPPVTPPAPPVAPAVTAEEKKLAAAPASQVAAALGLPSARSCVSRRRFTVRIRQPRGVRLASAELLIGKRRIKARRVNGRLSAVVDLRGQSKRRFTITITAKTESGKTLRGVRRYRTCAPKRRSGGSVRP